MNLQLLKDAGQLFICLVIAYIFMRGLLGVFFELANWAVNKLEWGEPEAPPKDDDEKIDLWDKKK